MDNIQVINLNNGVSGVKTIDLGGTSQYEVTSNKTTTVSKSSTDIQYPSAKATYNAVHPDSPSSIPEEGMLPNILYELGTLSSDTTFTLDTTNVDQGANHYFWTFDISNTIPTITWPSGLLWVDGGAPAVAKNKHYEISVLNGIAIVVEA